jgi:hypothetical protein
MLASFPFPKACLLALGALALGTSACQNDDDAVVPWENTRVAITSDPEGAIIEVDGANTGRLTPATLSNLVGRHSIVVRLEADGISYGYRADVDVRGDSVHRITGPLMYRCVSPACPLSSTRERDLGNVRVATQPNGALFTRQANGQGLRWPIAGNVESYASTGLPLVGMIVSGSRDTLALGIYDTEYLTGRPHPVTEIRGDTTTLRQSMWMVPPTEAILNNMPTVRGIEVEEELVGSGSSDVVLLKLTFRNITNRETYRAADPVVPPAGLTFEQTYVGFALDPDIGNPADDMITYEPALDLVYAYDQNFLEEGFNATNSSRPGLVGLRLVSAPAAASAKVLNAWPAASGTQTGDWHAGTISEPNGYGILNGWRSVAPDFPGQQIGYVPSIGGDYRMWVGAGPLTLAPGDAVTMTVAIIMAWPVQGEFTSGQPLPPGDPATDNRQIRRVAATLIDRARNLK